MIQEIKTVEDVKTFFNELYEEGLSFHPDDLFEQYIHRNTGKPLYSEEEAKQRNTLLAQAFNVCKKEDADIYELGMEIFMKDFYRAFPPKIECILMIAQVDYYKLLGLIPCSHGTL
jgi:hypothetical protein